MSDTGGNQTAPKTYDGYVEKMIYELDRNFGTSTPVQTRRSTGLNSQAGLILGALPNMEALYYLCEALRGLPAGWSVYPESALHYEFGVYADHDARQITEPINADFRSLVEAARQLAGQGHRFTNTAFQDLRLMASRDKLILAGTPNHPTFMLRRALLAAAESANSLIGTESLEMHLTLAQLKRPLSDYERGITDNFLENTRLPKRVILEDVLVGGYVIRHEAFSFSDLHRITVPIPS